MIKQSQEQRADKLWQDYPIGKEAYFWLQYEELLGDQKKERKKWLKAKRQEPDTQSYIPRLFNHLLYLIAYLLLASFFFLSLLENTSEHSFCIFVGLIIILLLLLSIIEIGYVLPYITVTKQGIYVRKKLLQKSVFFTWELLRHIEIVEEREVKGDNNYTLHVYTQDNKVYKTLKCGYQLSKSEHQKLVYDMTKRGIRINYIGAVKYAQV
jgi:hypothetical protein